MPKNKEEVDRGKTLLSWEFKEFTEHKRGKYWYFWTILILAAVLIWSFFTGNLLFTIIIVVIGVIYIFQHRRKPMLLEIRIKEDGVEIGRNFYQYRDMKNFWVIYEPPDVKMLYLDFKSTFRPTFPVPLENQNPLKVREVLKKYLEEDLEKEEEPTSDAISRSLKI